MFKKWVFVGGTETGCSSILRVQPEGGHVSYRIITATDGGKQLLRDT
jgi:hypothetical protein